MKPKRTKKYSPKPIVMPLNMRRATIDMTRGCFDPARIKPEVYSNELLIERIGMDPIIVRTAK